MGSPSPLEIAQQRASTGNFDDGHSLGLVALGGGMGCVHSAEMFATLERRGIPPDAFNVVAGESGSAANALAFALGQAHLTPDVFINTLPQRKFIGFRHPLQGKTVVQPRILRATIGELLDTSAIPRIPTDLIVGATRLDDLSHHLFSTDAGTLHADNVVDTVVRGAHLPLFAGPPPIAEHGEDGSFWADSGLSNVYLHTLLVLARTGLTDVVVLANAPTGRRIPNPIIDRVIGNWIGDYHEGGREEGRRAYADYKRRERRELRELKNGHTPNGHVANVQIVTPAPLPQGVKRAGRTTTDPAVLSRSAISAHEGMERALKTPDAIPVKRLVPAAKRQPLIQLVGKIVSVGWGRPKQPQPATA